MVIITSVAVLIAPFIIYVLITNSPRCGEFLPPSIFSHGLFAGSN